MPEKIFLSEEQIFLRILRFREVLKAYLKCRCTSSLELCVVCLYEMLYQLANNGIAGAQNMNNIAAALGLEIRGSWVQGLAGLRHRIAHCSLLPNESVESFLALLDTKRVLSDASKLLDTETTALLARVLNSCVKNSNQEYKVTEIRLK